MERDDCDTGLHAIRDQVDRDAICNSVRVHGGGMLERLGICNIAFMSEQDFARQYVCNTIHRFSYDCWHIGAGCHSKTGSGGTRHLKGINVCVRPAIKTMCVRTCIWKNGHAQP